MQDKLSDYVKVDKKNKYKQTNYLAQILKTWSV